MEANYRLDDDSNPNFVSPQAIAAYEESLRKHIDAVYLAGIRLGLSTEQLRKHDESKWSNEEFYAYAQQFHGNKANPTKYSLAWLHHIHHNPHHWQHWLHPAGYVVKGTDLDCSAFEMPENYALEMIADWLGSSYCYTGSWDMTNWLKKNWLEIVLHTETRKFIYDVLQEIQNGKVFS